MTLNGGNMSFSDDYIDKNTPIPLYYQLKTIILNKIQSGELKAGDMLPTEAEFNEIYNLSRTTVRQAIVELVSEGYLHRTKGKGTFVSEPKILQDFMRKLESYSDQMKRLNMTAKTKVLDIGMVKASEKVAKSLGVKEGSYVIKLERLRYANDEPIVILDTFLPDRCRDILDVDMEKTSLYDHLSKKGNTRIIRVIRQIEAVGATKRESELLETHTGYPIQLTTTTGYNELDEPIEYSIARYRGDKNKFIVELYV